MVKTFKAFDLSEQQLDLMRQTSNDVKIKQNGLDFEISIINFGLNDNSRCNSDKIEEIAADKIYSNSGETLAQTVFRLFQGTKHVFAVAESLTGGLVAAELVSVAGISQFFYEGIVAYDNSAKIKRLGVSEDTLKNFGAVSSQTASEMVSGLIASGNTLAVSTTGIAGPSGGSKEKPVGTVWFGLADGTGRVYTEKRVFSGDREQIRMQATQFALHLLIGYLGGTIRFEQ